MLNGKSWEASTGCRWDNRWMDPTGCQCDLRQKWWGLPVLRGRWGSPVIRGHLHSPMRFCCLTQRSWRGWQCWPHLHSWMECLQGCLEDPQHPSSSLLISPWPQLTWRRQLRKPCEASQISSSHLAWRRQEYFWQYEMVSCTSWASSYLSLRRQLRTSWGAFHGSSSHLAWRRQEYFCKYKLCSPLFEW